MPTALNITILETLALFDGPLREFADGVCDDAYAVWLGAGISLGKLPGLPGVAESVLEHVRAKIDPADANCEWKACLDAILGLVALSSAQRGAINYAEPVSAWASITEVKQQLVSRYGTMLDLAPLSGRPDALVWDGVKVVERYADPVTTPGAEHLGLAAMIIEGVASEAASANWDDLIEKAVRILDGVNSTVLQVRVLPADVQNNVRRARLYKFHGCAALAGVDEATYRDKVVARESQIHGWADKPENGVIAGKLVDLAVSKKTLMIGLSAQDTNIQEIFVKARVLLPANFPTHPPAVMVSGEQVGAHQRSLLQNFYRDDYPTNTLPIHTASLVRAYAKSLLPALWLHVVSAKLSALIDSAVPHLTPEDRDGLRLGLVRLRDLAAAAADPTDHESYMLTAVARLGRAVRLLRRGRAPVPGEGIYAPITDAGLTRTLANPHLGSEGLMELSLALALVGCGEKLGHWSCASTDPADVKAGPMVLTGASGTCEMFFAASAHAAAQLFEQGHVADTDDAVVIHSFPVPPRGARHPTSAPGRTGKVTLREFSVSSVTEGAESLDSLLQQFRAEMAL